MVDFPNFIQMWFMGFMFTDECYDMLSLLYDIMTIRYGILLKVWSGVVSHVGLRGVFKYEATMYLRTGSVL